MSTVLEKVEQDALSLPRQERAFLADRLLSSLGGEVLDDIEEAWVLEVERRYREYKEGRADPIPASEVFAEADRLFE
uniref:Putative addiction module component, TIGR02574 family n=1 Tax=Candidatus Kentrum sp. TUN TaxID=2126343 RepID=A0A451AE62_9GAMM|nr:MAG: putative addiction module component, TIGR02574 family [Candidatus Kentron sp. TUN]VFK55701.1 MAG: putative addiction module component, TIGR02574 family [Candidatus Kentron sp. TUN]VFK64308.1 MAG: putative addiction module component, TIGR02574 family [Candidatus Kentron sp. TUN]